MDAELREKLLEPLGRTPNVLALECEPFNDGRKSLEIANGILRSIAQQCIAQIHEHRHLKQARVLLVVERSEAAGKKLEAGERVQIGKASKASPRDKLLTAVIDQRRTRQAKLDVAAETPAAERPDFVVKLNGNWLEMVGAEDGDEDGLAKAAALVDHELSHCGVKLAGKFLAEDAVEKFVEELGDKHVETCQDVTREGKCLVRFWWTDKSGGVKFCMRKHDLEEFCGVVERHGRWDRAIGKLVDVLEKEEATATA
jgi:hypothetical protein